MKKQNIKNPWINESKKTITQTKFLLSNLSVYVRGDQFKIFQKIFAPRKNTQILDVGVSSDLTFKDTNMFDNLYPWQNKLTLVTIENARRIKKLFPRSRVVQVKAGDKLPFKNKKFDIVVSWATLEHVGGFEEQKKFLTELSRVSKKFFITTPYRGCIYEPHTGYFFLHWLPLSIFRKICDLIGKNFWSEENHLNPLNVRDVIKISPRKNLKIKIYKTLGIIPSHLLIYAK